MALSSRTVPVKVSGIASGGFPLVAGHDAGHGLVDIDPVRTAQYGLAASEGRPGKADTRLKILVVLVIDRIDVRPDAHERSRLRIEDDEPIVTLARRHVPFVTQAELQRQIRSQFVIVLDKKSQCSLSDAAASGCPTSR